MSHLLAHVVSDGAEGATEAGAGGVGARARPRARGKKERKKSPRRNPSLLTMAANPFQQDAAGAAFMSLPRLAGRLTADLVMRSHQGLNACKEYQLDLRGACTHLPVPRRDTSEWNLPSLTVCTTGARGTSMETGGPQCRCGSHLAGAAITGGAVVRRAIRSTAPPSPAAPRGRVLRH